MRERVKATAGSNSGLFELNVWPKLKQMAVQFTGSML